MCVRMLLNSNSERELSTTKAQTLVEGDCAVAVAEPRPEVVQSIEVVLQIELRARLRLRVLGGGGLETLEALPELVAVTPPVLIQWLAVHLVTRLFASRPGAGMRTTAKGSS